MSPEMMIAIACVVSGLLLVMGGMLVGGRGAADERASQGDNAELRFKLEQAEASGLELRKQMDSERSNLEMKIAAAKLERDRYSSDLQKALEAKEPAGETGSVEEFTQLRARLTEAEQQRDALQQQVKEISASASRATIPVDASEISAEVERELVQAREELERLRRELANQDARIVALQAAADQSAAEMERLTAERDEARERKEAADRIIEAVRARSSGLQQQLKEAQAELSRVRG